jgi:hypothetical protein
MTRLKFLELAMEGAHARVGHACPADGDWNELRADRDYCEVKLKAERTRLALKERNKGALAQALDKAKLTPRAQQYLEQFK